MRNINFLGEHGCTIFSEVINNQHALEFSPSRYLDDLNPKGIVIWIAPVVECESDCLGPINALFPYIIVS
jgi:hypothetical protein